MYFAKINENNIVETVIVADQEFIDTLSGTWIETDINGLSPINYAGVGYTYSEEDNAFIAPRPFESWELNQETFKWEAPEAMPLDGQYYWDEEELAWVSIT